MKKSQKHFLNLLLALAVLPFAACASNPTAASSSAYSPENPAPFKINEPFLEYLQDTDDAFRARASAEAMSAMVAQKAAEMNAKVSLAGKISTAIDSLSKTNAANAQQDATITTQMRFYEMAKAHVQHTLKQVHMLGQETHRDPKDGRYIVYVAIEVNKKAVAEALSNQASQTTPEQKAKLLADFEKAFDETK